jgi:hypothetical protein
VFKNSPNVLNVSDLIFAPLPYVATCDDVYMRVYGRRQFDCYSSPCKRFLGRSAKATHIANACGCVGSAQAFVKLVRRLEGSIERAMPAEVFFVFLFVLT